MLRALLCRFIGDDDDRKIPKRVQDAIIEQQNVSEQLVGWIQLAVVLTFGTLYAVSPKTFRMDAPFEPVPYVLSLYFGFTLIRLYFSYRMRLPGWVISLSIVADIYCCLAQFSAFISSICNRRVFI